MPIHIACKGCYVSAESTVTDLQTVCGLQISLRTLLIEIHGMGFPGPAVLHTPYIPKSNAKYLMQSSHYWTPNVFSEVKNNASLSCNPMDECGFDSCQISHGITSHIMFAADGHHGLGPILKSSAHISSKSKLMPQHTETFWMTSCS